MQLLCRSIFAVIVVSSTCLGQNARDYYKELYGAGGLDRNVASYACFNDDAESKAFFLFIASRDIPEVMIAAGTFAKLPKDSQAELKKDFLEVRGYNEGVAFPEEETLDADGYSWIGQKFPLDKHTARVRFSVSWETLRFRREVEVLNPNGTYLPAAGAHGRCERVSPGVRQHGR